MAKPKPFKPGKPGKQLRADRLPSRSALKALVGGDPANRQITGYAKATPADANGLGQVGFDILRMSRGGA